MNEANALIARVMKQRISAISGSKAALARLRRGIGKKLGELPELLEFVLPPDNLLKNPRQEIMAEKAIYTALTLYAFHQQGCNNCMNVGVGECDYKSSFGHAVRRLVSQDKTNEVAITRKFSTVLTAKDITELGVHARSLVGLLRNADIPLDYSTLAVELFCFQQEDFRRCVVLRWGKDYYMTGKDE